LSELRKKILEMLSLSGREEAVAKGIRDLTDEEKIDMLSNLYPFEDEELASIYLIAKRYNVTFLEDYLKARLKLRCSVFGWRANQIVNIASEKRREQARWGFFRRLFKRKEMGLGEIEEFE